MIKLLGKIRTDPKFLGQLGHRVPFCGDGNCMHRSERKRSEPSFYREKPMSSKHSIKVKEKKTMLQPT